MLVVSQKRHGMIVEEMLDINASFQQERTNPKQKDGLLKPQKGEPLENPHNGTSFAPPAPHGSNGSAAGTVSPQ